MKMRAIVSFLHPASICITRALLAVSKWSGANKTDLTLKERKNGCSYLKNCKALSVVMYVIVDEK